MRKAVSRLALLALLPALPAFADFLTGGYSGLHVVRVGTPFTYDPHISGGTPPYQFNWYPATAPAGLSFDSSTGVISGTPTEIGNFTIAVGMRESSGVLHSFGLYLSVTKFDLQVMLHTTLPTGTVGQTYWAGLRVDDGTGPYRWTLSAGTLPPGLYLVGTDRAAPSLQGAPTEGGTWDFTLQVTDALGRSALPEYTVTVIGPQATTTTLPAGAVSQSYRATLQASGGDPPYRWSIASGALPPGLALEAGGVISGTPTASGTYSFMASLVDSNGAGASVSLSILIAAARLRFTTTSLADAVAGAAWSATIAATGGEPPLTFSISAGKLPDGLSLASTGILAGTPSREGAYQFTVQVRDTAGQSTTGVYTLKVAADTQPAITGVASATSFSSPVSPGSWVSIFGRNLAPQSGAGRKWKPDEIIGGLLPTSLDSVTVTVNGRAAAISWAGPKQLNVQAPDDTATGPVEVRVTTPGGTASAHVELQRFAPGLFTYVDGQGTWAAATHADGTAVTAASPARAGETIVLWGSGFGPTNPPQPAGRLVRTSGHAQPVYAFIGNQVAEVAWSGLSAPGLDQMNVRVPELATGVYPVVATVQGAWSQAAVHIPVSGR